MKLPLILAMCVGAALPTSAMAQCDSWSIEGELTIRHSDGTIVHAQLKQTGDRLTGTARRDSPAPTAAAGLSGTIREDGLSLRIAWPGETRIYDGGIYPDGFIDGLASAQATRSKVTWEAPQLAQCADW